MIYSYNANLEKAEAADIKKLKDLPTGSIVYDPSWEWEIKTGDNYTGNGIKKAVEWLVVAQDHYQNSTTGTVIGSHTTLISNELLGKHVFDNFQGGGGSASASWKDSGVNSTKGIRKFLNGSAYIGDDTNNYPICFYDVFSEEFKSIVLETTLATTKDKVFYPSDKELGGNYIRSDGSNWGYFLDRESRIASIENQNNYYFSRTPYTDSVNPNVCYVDSYGNLGHTYFAYYAGGGIRPVVNLKSDTLVKSVDGRWEIVYNNSPTIIISTSNNQGLRQVVD